MSGPKLIVSVFGESGAGKTSLTRALAQEMGEELLCVVNADYYLEDRGSKALYELTSDFDLLASHLSQPVGTLCHYPEYDFVAFKRISLHGPLTFSLRPIIIVEQMHPYPNADLYIHLDLPWRVAVERVLRRDPPEWEWRRLLAAKWQDIPTISNSDAVRMLPHKLVLDATLPIENNVASAKKSIAAAWKGKGNQVSADADFSNPKKTFGR